MVEGEGEGFTVPRVNPFVGTTARNMVEGKVGEHPCLRSYLLCFFSPALIIIVMEGNFM